MGGIIKYHNVDLYRQQYLVLKDVSFTVNDGEFIYLIGRVGSGKSTLLRSLYADVPVTEGEARVFDFDLTRMRRRDIPYLRRNIGFVFQDFQLLMDRSVYANLDFVLEATGWSTKLAREQRIEEVLKLVGMETKSYKMPHELSGGEQQRIVIARAMLNDPKLILADEPTGNLDPETGEQIIRRLLDISRGGTTVIIATHNMALLEQFPGRILRCQDKELIINN